MIIATAVYTTVKMAVHVRDHVYLLSLSTRRYELRFHPFGQSNTSLRINASDELKDRARIFSIGKRQARISKKQIKAMTQSPILLR